MPGARSAAAPPSAGLCPRGSRRGQHSSLSGFGREAARRSGIERFRWQAAQGVFSLASEDVESGAYYMPLQGRPANHALVSTSIGKTESQPRRRWGGGLSSAGHARRSWFGLGNQLGSLGSSENSRTAYS